MAKGDTYCRHCGVVIVERRNRWGVPIPLSRAAVYDCTQNAGGHEPKN